jgi:predicted metal-dependent hydrolase
VVSEVVDIRVRPLTFEVERGAGGLWNPARPELSHTLNAFQLSLPYLEPYFIDAIREAADRVADPKLKAEVLAFCSQEANHSRQHKRYCRLLQKRYPRLQQFEKAIQQSLLRSRREDSLERRLAYTAGYEAITAQLSRWMLRNAGDWFEGADPHFAALMTWHAAEELEHRHVAYDVLQAVSTSYGLRARGMFGALKKTLADIVPVVTYMLEVDGYAARFDSKMRRLKLRLQFSLELLPAVRRYLTPGYNPAHDASPPELAEWQSRAEHMRSAGTLAEPIGSEQGDALATEP